MKLALIALLLAAACGTDDSTNTDSLTRAVGECGPYETHVVGVFEPGPNQGGSDGTILINVNRPGHHTIVVSAHEAAKWKIVASNGAKVTDVYAVGMAKQNVIAPAGTNVMTEEPGTAACGYTWPGAGDCDTKGLLRLASIRLNKHATSFHGCYKASQFTIGEDLAVAADCANNERATGGRDVDVSLKSVVTRCEPDKDESDCDGPILY
jgi:hypothetical protein